MCLQAAVFTPQMAAPYYYPQLYGPTSPTNVGPSPYQHHYPNLGLGYSMQSPRGGFPSLAPGPRPPLMQHTAPHMEGLPMPSSSHDYFFQLHAPQHAMALAPLNSTLGNHLLRVYLFLFFLQESVAVLIALSQCHGLLQIHKLNVNPPQVEQTLITKMLRAAGNWFNIFLHDFSCSSANLIDSQRISCDKAQTFQLFIHYLEMFQG